MGALSKGLAWNDHPIPMTSFAACALLAVIVVQPFQASCQPLYVPPTLNMPPADRVFTTVQNPTPSVRLRVQYGEGNVPC
jgi:hypothetical protein